MNKRLIDQWLSSHGIMLEQSFVPALKDYARAYKKRPVSVCLIYTHC